MPMGGFVAAAPAAQDEEEAAPKAVKTNFTVSIYLFMFSTNLPLMV